MYVDCNFEVTSDGSPEENTFLKLVRLETELWVKVPVFDKPDGLPKGEMWTAKEINWLETGEGKFEFRQAVVDNPITRSIVDDLDHYRRFGELKWAYRHSEDYIMLKHLKTLNEYWD